MKKKLTKKAKPTKHAVKKATKPAKKKMPPTVIKSLDTTGGVKKAHGEMAKYQRLLLNLRDHVIDQISGLAGENLRHNPRETAGDLSGYSFHMADTGTDNFDREFALSLVSSEQEALYEVEGALKRIDLGTFGKCESCEKTIAKERLMAVPFARMCVRCQSEAERNRKRVAVQTATFSEITDESGEEEEEE
ncbi:MAG: TraR/DksA family transcriptional regulator [Verrucomicrobia bacterium]|nr:TraR/DksA family transcriptional regulator [Verrucomicrobiota bacterium]